MAFLNTVTEAHQAKESFLSLRTANKSEMCLPELISSSIFSAARWRRRASPTGVIPAAMQANGWRRLNLRYVPPLTQRRSAHGQRAGSEYGPLRAQYRIHFIGFTRRGVNIMFRSYRRRKGRCADKQTADRRNICNTSPPWSAFWTAGGTPRLPRYRSATSSERRGRTSPARQ